MAKKGDDIIELPAEQQMWQVIFMADGHGQQVYAASEEEVRAEMARIYGEDYEIKSISPL